MRPRIYPTRTRARPATTARAANAAATPTSSSPIPPRSGAPAARTTSAATTAAAAHIPAIAASRQIDHGRLPPGGNARLDRPPRELGREEQAGRVRRRPGIDRSGPDGEPHCLLGAEEDDAGRERGAPARGQAQAEPEQAARRECQHEQLVVVRLQGAAGRECRRRGERDERGR